MYPPFLQSPLGSGIISLSILRTGLVKNQLEEEVEWIYKANYFSFCDANLDLDPHKAPAAPQQSPPATVTPQSTLPDNNGTASSQVTVPGKFNKFVALVKLLFAVPTFDAADDLMMVTPESLSSSLKDSLTTTISIKDLSRDIISILAHLFDTECTQSRDFLLKAADPPVINHALIGFFVFLFPTVSL